MSSSGCRATNTGTMQIEGPQAGFHCQILPSVAAASGPQLPALSRGAAGGFQELPLSMQTCLCSALGMLWHPGGCWWVPAPGKCNLPRPHPLRTRTLPRGLADVGRGHCQLRGDGSSERITQLNCLASCEHQQRILFLHLFSVGPIQLRS